MPRFIKKTKRKRGGNPLLAALISGGVAPLIGKVIDKIWPDKQAKGKKHYKRTK